MKRTLGLALVVILSFTLAGCSRPQRPRAKLTGKVTLDGKLVTIGTVTVFAEDGMEEPGQGQIEKDGSYTVPNAPIGKVKIRILRPELAIAGAAKIDAALLKKAAPKQGEQMVSAADLEKAAKASAKASGDKKLEPIKFKGPGAEVHKDREARFKTIEKMPEFYADPTRSGITFTVDKGGSTMDIVLTTTGK